MTPPPDDRPASGETRKALKRGQRWMVRVRYAVGYDAYLRRGSPSGCGYDAYKHRGPIVQFRSKLTAQAKVGLITPELKEGTVVVMVPYDRSKE